MLLGVEGVRLDPSEHAQGDLLTALLRAPAAIRTYYGDGLRASGLALSPDGRILALEDNVPSIFFLDTATGRRLRKVTNFPGPPSATGFASDGKLVMFGGNNPPTEVDFLDPATGRIVRRLPLPAAVSAATGPFSFRPGYDWANFVVNNFAFADGRRRLAVAVSGYLLQWALPQGRMVTAPVAVPFSDGLVFYTDGGRRLVAAGRQRTSVLDARTGRVVRTYAVGGLVAALSPDGTTMVFGDAAGSVRFLDLATGVVTQSTSAHQGGVRAAGFTPDGKTVITSGNDGRTLLWDVATHQVVRTFAGHAGVVSVQAISADGSTLYTGSVDGTAIGWDMRGTRSFGTTFRAAASNPAAGSANVALSPDGATLAVGATDGTVNLWDVRSQRKIARPSTAPSPPAAPPWRSPSSATRPRLSTPPSGRYSRAGTARRPPSTCSARPCRPTAPAWQRPTSRGTCGCGTRQPASRCCRGSGRRPYTCTPSPGAAMGRGSSLPEATARCASTTRAPASRSARRFRYREPTSAPVPVPSCT